MGNYWSDNVLSYICNGNNLGHLQFLNFKLVKSNDFIILKKKEGSNIIQIQSINGTISEINNESHLAIFASNICVYSSNQIITDSILYPQVLFSSNNICSCI
jgi:hypothetical protein